MDYNDVQAEVLEGIGSLPADELVRLVLERHRDDPDAYAKVVASLLSVLLDEQDARHVLRDILEHHQTLSDRLSGPIDLRVAAMDFAVRHTELIHEPVVVDRGTFELSQRLAAIDALTGLYNRRFLEMYLLKELNRAQRYGQIFSVVFVDLDNFKQVNDTHGHAVGDRVLQTFGRQISALLRREDVAARYGGEEFVVILPHTDTDGALSFSNRLADRLGSIDFEGMRVTFSGGVATFPQHGLTAEALLRNADTALYQSKLNGKRQVRAFNSDKRVSPRHRIDLSATGYADGRELGHVQLCDISYNGLSMRVLRAVERGQTLRLRIAPDDSGEYDVVAQVVWARKVGETAYQIGGQWKRADSTVLTTLIDRAVHPSSPG